MANEKKVMLSALAVLLMTGVFSSRAQCAKVYRFTGEVIEIKKDTVKVRRGSDVAEFARPEDMSKVHKGDRITVFYSMDAQQIIQSPQEAGTAAGTDQEQHLILDDRAFYNAKNQARPNGKNPG